jgi:hypothetical protein
MPSASNLQAKSDPNQTSFNNASELQAQKTYDKLHAKLARLDAQRAEKTSTVAVNTEMPSAYSDEQLIEDEFKTHEKIALNATKAVGTTVEKGGAAVEKGGAAVEKTGQAIASTGSGIETVGKGVNTVGEILSKSGEAISSSKVGAVIGAPMMALGSAGSAVGKTTETVGKGVKNTGKAVQQTGSKIKNAGETVRIIGQEGKTAIDESARQEAIDRRRDRENMSRRLAPGTTLKPFATPFLQPAPSRTAMTGLANEGLGGDTELIDQSIFTAGEEQRPSVLDMGAPQSAGTYVQGVHVPGPMAGEDEFERFKTLGGGEYVVGAEIASQQARDRAAIEAQAALTGIVGPAIGALTEIQPTGGVVTEEEEEEEEGLEPEAQGQGGQGQLERAQQMIEDKAEEKLKKEIEKRVKGELKKRFGQKAGQKAAGKTAEKALEKAMERAAAQAAAKGASASARVSLEGIEAALAPETVAITLLIMMVQMNIQMIVKYLMKGTEALAGSAEETAGEMFGENAGRGVGFIASFMQQSLIEDFITIFLDSIVILGANPGCCCLIIIIMVFIAIALGYFAGTDSDAQSMFSTWMGGS